MILNHALLPCESCEDYLIVITFMISSGMDILDNRWMEDGLDVNQISIRHSRMIKRVDMMMMIKRGRGQDSSLSPQCSLSTVTPGRLHSCYYLLYSYL